MSKFNRAVFVRNIPIQKSWSIKRTCTAILNLVYTLLDTIWWKYVPGTTINVPWPKPGEVQIPSNFFVTVPTADPNDLYRPTLEHYCGRQYLGWHWRFSAPHNIEIKFRVGKSRLATLFAIRWA